MIYKTMLKDSDLVA